MATTATARVFDAHCPHLGAHLGVGGQVCGDGIACPFHGWRFDGEGQLVEVPGLDRPPRAARTGVDGVRAQRTDLRLAPRRGRPPGYDVTGYRQDESDWTPWRSNTYRVRVHVQDLTENIIDRSHFVDRPRHGTARRGALRRALRRYLHDRRAEPEGDRRRRGRLRGPAPRTTTCGPGIVAVEVDQDPIEMLTYITQTPVDDELTEVDLALLDEAHCPDDERRPSRSPS